MLRVVHAGVVFQRLQMGNNFRGNLKTFRQTFLDLRGDTMRFADRRAVRRWRAPVSISGKALVIASAAGLLLLLGFVAYANRRPASPLAPGALLMNGSVKQSVPFGPATITPSAATPKPSPVPPANAAPAARPKTPKPSAARRSADLHRRPSRDDSSTAKLKQDPDAE